MFRRFASRPVWAALVLALGCQGRTALETGLSTERGGVAPDAGASLIERSNKLDVLFVVDNSPNTDALHELLSASVPTLLSRIANPACVDAEGAVVAQPTSAADPCPAGVRQIPPQQDVHLAVISTSLGGHGADLCSPASLSFKPEQNDAAHLLTRAAGGGVVPTYLDRGFLAWDPGQAASPPGEQSLGSLSGSLSDLIRGAGTSGCGFEAPLESLYRFLVDPEPYLSIDVVDGKAAPSGADTLLLQQRADFVRPDSAVLIVLATDENDCSTREGGQYYLANQGGDPFSPGQVFHLPRARTECADDPNDPCCASCGQETPKGCLPNSANVGCLKGPFSDADDPVNLRCFEQKRRFGLDFLYPIERYTRGLSEPTIATRDGSIVDNPLFAGNRSPKLVMVTGVVGVPWQDVARDPADIARGLRSAAEIDWNLILGSPPADPLMIESIDPRKGASPAVGMPLAAPTSGPFTNPINGHERDILGRDDLQYACIYPRLAPSPCVGPGCPCNPPGNDPICQSSSGAYGTTAVWGRALPGVRELSLLRSLGERATVASVCAASASPAGQPQFGYVPAFEATLRMLRGRIE